MQKKLSPDYSHNNQKSWTQLLCKETDDNFFCIYSNGPKPCNHYKVWVHWYKCRRNYRLITHVIKRAGPNYYVRKGTIFSSAFMHRNGPKPCNHYRFGPNFHQSIIFAPKTDHVFGPNDHVFGPNLRQPIRFGPNLVNQSNYVFYLGPSRVLRHEKPFFVTGPNLDQSHVISKRRWTHRS